MRKAMFLCALALTVLALPSLAHAHLEMSGPSRILVPYNECVTATWTVSPTHYDSYSWTFDSSTVSSSTSYSRTFCSPGVPEMTTDLHTVVVTGTNNGVNENDSTWVIVDYFGDCEYPGNFCLN